MTPEEKARIKIDQWFADAGWKVVPFGDNREINRLGNHTRYSIPIQVYSKYNRRHYCKNWSRYL